VQVDEDETNWRAAKSEGLYHVRHWVRCYAESLKKKVKECNYWPEIKELKADDSWGKIIPTRPEKVRELMVKKPQKAIWYQDTINLFLLKLYGPFDFENGYHIPKAVWKHLMAVAEDEQVYVGNVNRTVRLDKPDEQDKNLKGKVETWLAQRGSIYDGES
jgi:hypothetical protein